MGMEMRCVVVERRREREGEKAREKEKGEGGVVLRNTLD